MKYDSFDLEQQIMTCWQITEDLKVLNEGVLEKDLTTDEISNILMGLTNLYELKFQKLFEYFEQSIK
jgi:uncharacterized protein YfkK (UPF0435 family)